MGLEEALTECDTFVFEDDIPWSKIAAKHHVVRSTLTRRWRATRVINNNSIHPISQHSAGTDSDRHVSSPYFKYKLYFDLLLAKIAKHKIKSEHIYNMCEKGFMIGATTGTQHVFSRRMWKKGQVKASLQDGNRAWITLLACVCGDGSALPPGLLYQSANSTTKSSWVEESQPGVHSILVSSSPTGWTDNNIGLAWLQQVFDRFTKTKARRKWRLLLLDGCGSYVTMEFIKYCIQNKILLAMFPPHSAHTLQPLDVTMFEPLSTAYSKELTTYLRNGQELSVVKKSDFLHLFWKAWARTFTQGLILKSFQDTGITPLQPTVILDRFTVPSPQASHSIGTSSSSYSGKGWFIIEALLCEVERSKELRKLRRLFHHVSVENQLLHREFADLRELHKTQKKHKDKKKHLNLQNPKEYHGGALLYSHHKDDEARQYEQVKQQETEAEAVREAEMGEPRHTRKLYKERVAQEKREQRVREKEERDRVKAKKAEELAERKAERERQKQVRDAQKAVQVSQRGNKKSSKASVVKKKPVRRSVGARSWPKPATPPPSKRTHTTRSGRTATLFCQLS